MERFFFKQKTAYEISECDWSSDVCSSDLYEFWVDSSRNLTALTENHTPHSCLLYTSQGRRELEDVVINEKTKRDTFTFVYMKGDSLALSDRERCV